MVEVRSKELILSSISGDLQHMKLLLFSPNPVDPNYQGHNGMTALHHVVSLDQNIGVEFASILINAGASLTIEDDNTETPFHLAVKLNKLNLIQLFVDKCTSHLHGLLKKENSSGKCIFVLRA